jgi:hypothetical protein
MMQMVTWLSVLVLGPGSVAIFVWFLFGLREIFGEKEPDGDATETI